MLERRLPSIRAIDARIVAFRVSVWYNHGTRLASKQTIASPQVSQTAKQGKRPLNLMSVVIDLPLSDRQLNNVLPSHSKESYLAKTSRWMRSIQFNGAESSQACFPGVCIDGAHVKDGTRGLCCAMFRPSSDSSTSTEIGTILFSIFAAAPSSDYNVMRHGLNFGTVS